MAVRFLVGRGTSVDRPMMLSTPQKRFVWARSERFAEFTFFRTMLKQRRRTDRLVRVKEQQRASGRWKPAAWTPWLWMK
jgi:hypothetical protein